MAARSRRPLAVLAGSGLVLAAALSWQPSAAGAAQPDSGARGRVHTGLVAADKAHCKGHGYVVAGNPEICTHGPDDGPAGQDVRTRKSTSELQAEAARARAGSGGPLTTVGATMGTSTPSTDGTGQVVCEGDGVSGARVQVLYVRAADVASRFDALRDTIGSYMLAMDGKYNASAQETGGSRHVRFVTEPSAVAPCQLSLREVVLSSTGDDSFSNTITELKSQGWTGTSANPRKFLTLVDANVYCGIGQLYGDDTAAATNSSNTVVSMYNRSDNGCWNYAEPHELMHNLGGVQNSAPHSTGAGHCYDENDIECYNDGGPTSTLQYLCPSSHEQRFDCNHDDYFHTDPPAGSYLATHWNTAMSRFLIAPTGPVADTTPPAAPSAVAVSTTGATVSLSWPVGTESDLAGYRVLRDGVQVATTGVVGSWSQSVVDGTYTYGVAAVDATGNVSAATSAAPVTVSTAPQLRTETVTGRLSKQGAASFSRTVAAGGTSTTSSSWVTVKGKQSAKALTVKIKDARGVVVASGSGTGAFTITWTAPASGALSWVLSGSGSASYSVGLSYYA